MCRYLWGGGGGGCRQSLYCAIFLGRRQTLGFFCSLLLLKVALQLLCHEIFCRNRFSQSYPTPSAAFTMHSNRKQSQVIGNFRNDVSTSHPCFFHPRCGIYLKSQQVMHWYKGWCRPTDQHRRLSFSSLKSCSGIFRLVLDNCSC